MNKKRSMAAMNMEESTKKNINLARNAANYFEKFERFDCQEILSQSPVHWLLSVEDFRFPIDPPVGLISRCFPFNQQNAILLLPVDESIDPFDYREIHQMLRELTSGIYLFNETPQIKLQANFDQSTTCQLPPAYIDTSIGQTLINVDYMMKGLWHGAYFPKDKRQKFTDKWRTNLDVNAYGVPESKKPLLTEFSGAGLIDITKDPEYADVYDNVPVDLSEPKEIEEETEFFLTLVDDIAMQMTLFQNDVKQHENLFVIDSDWFVSSVVRIFDERLDSHNRERIVSRLHTHEDIIRENLDKKKDTRRAMCMLKFVSFLVPFLAALRKRMKIPNTDKFLSHLTGEDVRTERELPPLLLGPETKCKNFPPSETYFNLHGGIVMDLETPMPSLPSPSIMDQYANLCEDAEEALLKHLNSEIPVQESYTIPTRIIDGKKYYLICLPVEPFYGGSPQKPPWLHYYFEEMTRYRPRKLPFNDVQIHEQFKKYFGTRRAIKYKTPHNGLKACAERGLVGMFQALIRKIAQSRLAKCDELGLTYMHYAAINNCPLIIALLLIQSMDVNIRRGQHLTQGGTTIGLDQRVIEASTRWFEALGSGNTPAESIIYAVISLVVSRPQAETTSAREAGDIHLSSNTCIFHIGLGMNATRQAGNDLLESVFRYDVFRMFHKSAYKGPTALHLAARTGAIDAVSCLISNFANISVLDIDGWMPIHHAAHSNQMPIVKLLIRRSAVLMEAETSNTLKSTPLLLAASSGSLSVVKSLITSGADITRTDTDNDGIVSLAAMRFHTNILEYLIQLNHPKVPMWKILVGMHCSPMTHVHTGMLHHQTEKKRESAVKCMEILSTLHAEYWFSILNAGGVAAIVEMMGRDSSELQTVAASVLCNISEQHDVRLACSDANAHDIIIKLLDSPIVEIQSRAAIILSDMACVAGNQEVVADNGGIPALIRLLESDLEDVLVNTVNALRVLCLNNKPNQTLVAQCGAVEQMVEFLTIMSDILQAATASSIAALTDGHTENQDLVIAEGVVKPIINLIKGRNVTVQVKAALALEALCKDNERSQKTFLKHDAPKAVIRLLKNINVTVREQGAKSLWALAGNTKFQQRAIAETVGIPHIIQMLLEPTEQLLDVGCKTAIALGRESIEKQNLLADADAFAQLVRLLRSHKVPMTVKKIVIKVMGILCVGVAYRNNSYTQKKLAEEGAIDILNDLFHHAPTPDVKVEVANTLGCVVLSNRENQDILRENYDFRFDALLNLLHSPDAELRLKSGMALTIFAFNNTPQQYAIREAGGINFAVFHNFLSSTIEYYQCYAAFQIVVLARVIRDKDQVTLTAQGITLLVNHLVSKDDKTVVLAASLLSSLAHTRAGIPDAMVTTGAMEHLIDHLYSTSKQIRTAVAITLGYMTYNKTAARILLAACRNKPGLFDQFQRSMGENARVSDDFLGDYRRAKTIGLPSSSLEVNGGPPAIPIHSVRPATTSQRNNRAVSVTNRAMSAPARIRLKSSQTKRNSGDSRDSRVMALGRESKTPEGPFKTRLATWS